MKILILGGTGMIGSNLYKLLSPKYNVYISSRKKNSKNVNKCIFFDAFQFNRFKTKLKPFDTIINAIGITNKIKNEKRKNIFYVNSEFVSVLNQFCKSQNIRLIHLSTNCVFNGLARKKYKENDKRNALDYYGASKYLAELNNNQLTLRFSCLGFENNSNRQLFNWFLSQKKIVEGYERVFFNGITTIELSKIIDIILLKHPNLKGLINIASDKSISKYYLLCLIKKISIKKLSKIKKNNKKYEYKVLNPALFKSKIRYKIPSYKKMIIDLNNAFLD